MKSVAVTGAIYAKRGLGEAQRWLVASAVVCAVHVTGTVALLNWPKYAKLSSDAAPAVLVELAPVPVAPESQHLDVAPGPEMMEAQPKAQPEVKPEEKAPVPELLQKPAEVELPAPAPEKEKQEPQKTKQPPQKAVEKKNDHAKPAPQTTAAPKLKMQNAARPAAPAAGNTAESQAAMASWRGALSAHLNRFKRSLNGAEGTAVVAFSVDPGGRVLGARLVASSGNQTADSEAVSMVIRASPVPAPPAGRGAVPVTVPIRYVR